MQLNDVTTVSIYKANEHDVSFILSILSIKFFWKIKFAYK